MLPRVLAAAAALACLAPLPAAAAPVPGSHEIEIGLATNAQGHAPDVAAELDRVPQGTEWLREDLLWSVVEPRDDEWDWSRYDALFERAAERGIQVLPVLNGAPAWVALGGSWLPTDHVPAVPEERLKFADFAAHVAARYGPDGEFWLERPELAEFAPAQLEIWNEPYIAKSAGGVIDGGAYAELVRATAGAVDAVNPEIEIGLSADWAPAGDPYERTTFIADMFERVNDLGAYYDFVSVHPYAAGSPDDTEEGFGFPRIGWIHALLLASGGGDVPFWITEVGWSTCDEAADASCVTEEEQAAYLARAIELAGSPVYDYVDALFVYRRTDFDSPDGAKEGAFGIEHADGSPKPAYEVFADAVGG